MNARRLLSILAAVTIAMSALTTAAFGHVERSAYWPDPGPDRGVSPAAGGKVQKARSLGSALKASAPGDTRVVCQRGSLKRALRSINGARKNGYTLRPSQGSRSCRRVTRAG